LAVTGGTVGGSGASATLTIPTTGSGIEFTDGTNIVNGVTKLTVNGAAISGTTPNASMVITASSAPTLLYLSTYPGIDPTGATDSRAGVVNFLAAIAGSKYTGVVDCPCYIKVGTSWQNIVFFASNTNLTFTSQGYFICDNICCPTFVIESNCSNCTFTNWSVQYIGTFGLQAIDINQANVVAVGSSANNITLTNYLIAHNGNTFASGYYSIWQGPVNMCANFMLRGSCNNISFIGGSVFAVQGASATSFCPMAFSFGADWLPGVAVSASTATSNPLYAGVPYNISFNGMTFDGCYFGWQGVVQNISIVNCYSKRYSDLWDGTSGTVTFSAGLGAGVTSATLLASWSYPTATYALTLSNNQIIYVLLTNGSAATGTFQSLVQTTGGGPTGTSTTLSANWTYASGAYVTTFSDGETRTATFTNGSTAVSWTVALTGTPNTALNVAVGTSAAVTAIATSGNQGGVGVLTSAWWFSPPHFAYLNSQNNFPCTVQATNLLDYGTYVGPATRRSQASGSLLSYKLELSNNNVFNGLVSFRADGFADWQNTGIAPGAQVSNCFGVFNSQTATTNQTSSTYIWGHRFPNSTPYVNVLMNNVIIVDTAAAPVVVGFLGISSNNSVSCTFDGITVFSNDCPTYIPEIQMGGTNMRLRAVVAYGQDSSTTASISAFANYGSAIPVDCDFDITLMGWRSYPLVFTTAFANGATGGTLAANWPFTTGTYQLQFSSTDVRYVSLTNGSTTVGSFTALTAAAVATVTTTGLLNYNFNGLRSRILLNQSGKGIGNHLVLKDVTNGYFAEVRQGRLVESYTCQWSGTVPAGASYVIPAMTFLNTMGIETPAWQVTTAITGPTTVEIGTNTSASAIVTGLPIAAGDTPLPLGAPVSMSGTNGTIVITGVGGSFSGTGAITIAVTGTQVSVCP
jgi:hypothetical protein